VAGKEKIIILWLRRDLRLRDNVALNHALDSNHPVLPIFIFDTEILDKLSNKKDVRVQFIHDKVTALKKELEDHESSLWIFHGTSEKAIQELIKKYDVKAVYANRDYEPAAINRDDRVSELLAEQDINFHLFKDQVIFEGHEVLSQENKPYKVFTPYRRTWLEKYRSDSIKIDDRIDFNRFLRTSSFPTLSLDDIGFEENNEIKIPSSEIDHDKISKYDERRNFPGIDGTTRLGIHLRFGTISIRKLVETAQKLNDTYLNELIWREFYSAVLQNFPYVVDQPFKKKYSGLKWRNNEAEFKKWCQGETGFPIVDAAMREINSTGYMHNRARMIVASFLTKHLLIDWRWGEAYFAEKLLDYELASNNGGWQWAAGTGTDAQPYFRVFNPESQAEKFDPEQKYIKKWVPEFGSGTYPDPMVNHKMARKRAIEAYKVVV
jgi:deoxyribodipyrimidine photo-lyase